MKYPVITDINVHTQNGNMYRLTEKGWRQLECYLPSATGTYGEEISKTAERFIERIKMNPDAYRFATATKFVMKDGLLKGDVDFSKIFNQK